MKSAESNTVEAVGELEAFPEDAPDDLGEFVEPVYSDHQLNRLHRDVSDDVCGGATWRSADEEVKVMDYSACGYWAVEASELEIRDGRLHIDCKSNGEVSGLAREGAYELADEYMRGEADLEAEAKERKRQGQQTLDQIVTDGGVDE